MLLLMYKHKHCVDVSLIFFHSRISPFMTATLSCSKNVATQLVLLYNGFSYSMNVLIVKQYIVLLLQYQVKKHIQLYWQQQLS
jgi:hypothetical protein